MSHMNAVVCNKIKKKNILSEIIIQLVHSINTF